MLTIGASPSTDYADLFQNLVHRSTSKTFEIERHIFESQLAKSLRELVEQILSQYLVHLGRRNLQPDQLIVMADSELSKPKISQDLFTAIDFAQSFNRHRRSVCDTRRQARTRRLIPRRQRCLAAQLTHFTLG